MWKRVKRCTFYRNTRKMLLNSLPSNRTCITETVQRKWSVLSKIRLHYVQTNLDLHCAQNMSLVGNGKGRFKTDTIMIMLTRKATNL